MGVQYCTVNKAEQIAKTIVEEYGGGSGEPSQYVKNVVKDNNTLTFTKKDNTQVVYTPGEGKNWTDIELSISDMRNVTDGYQVIKSINAYDPTNFKNDYYRALVDNTGESVGEGIVTGDHFTNVKIDIKDFKTEGGARQDPDWYSSTFQKNISYLISDYGFDFHYYRSIVLYAGGTDVSEQMPVLEADPDHCNMVFLQDVSQQYWEKNDGDEKYATTKREGLEQEVYGLAYVLGIDKYTGETLTRDGILICYQESQSSYLDSGATKWANILPGKSYHVTFDWNTERWMLNSVIDDTREGHTGEKIAVELTDTEKTTWYTTGLTFPTGLYSAEVLYSATMGLKAQCFGNGTKELIGVFSWNEPFQAQTEIVKYEFIGRPAGYYLDTYTWEDEEGAKHTETDGEYVWYVEMGNDIISITIPASDKDTMIIEMSNNGTTLNSYTTLYRHTFNLYNNVDGTTQKPIPVQIGSDYWLLNISFCAVNAQAGDTGIDYLYYSDMNYQYPDWLLPVSGNIAKCDSTGTTISSVYDAKRIIATYYQSGEDQIRCLNIQYIDPTDLTTKTVELITPTTKDSFTCMDFRSEIASVIC